VQAAFDLSSAAAPRGVLLTRVSHTNAGFPAPSFVSRLQTIRIIALWWLLAPRGAWLDFAARAVTPLLAAVTKGWLRVAEALLSHGADPVMS
jgi:hypothetical protein